MKQDNHIYAKTAIEAIELFVRKKKRLIAKNAIPEELSLKRACFVSIHKNTDNSLRGCIGTIEPRFDMLFNEIVENAISAASKDYRFSPIKEKELQNLHVSVDVLTPPETTTPDQLNPAEYGLIVSDGFRRAVLLPALDGVETIEKQIDIVKRKAQLEMVPNEKLTFYRFQSKRYE